MWIVFKVDIVCEHIVPRKGRRTVIDCSEFLFRADKLIVVVRRRRSCAVDLIVRRCGHTAALVSDMGIAAVCRIGVKYNRACRRVHVCRIEEADVLAVHLDGIRRDVLAHIDDIRKPRRAVERRYIVRHISSGVYRGGRLRGDMEMPDVDHGILAEDDAVRIDDIDVVAALNLTVDVRGVRTCDDVQIVVRLCTTIMNNTLNTAQGVVPPFNHIVCVSGVDVRIIADTRNSRSTTHDLLARRRSKRDLWNQKSPRHSCDKGIVHPLR